MNKSILFVTDFYKPHKSGIITYIDLCIHSLKSKQFNITILTNKHNRNDKELEYLDGIKIIRCKPFLKISRGFYSIDLILKFLKIQKRFDIINLNLPLTEIFPLLFFLKKNKTVITYHCLPEFNNIAIFIKFFLYILSIIAMFRAKKILVLSKDYFKNINFHRMFSHKVIEIPPYIEIKNNDELVKTRNKYLKIGFLGRLSNEKGLENLIKVSNKMYLQKFKHELLIAGNDKDQRFIGYINKLKKNSAHNKNIKFAGYLNETQKNNFFNEIDLFVLPSLNSFEAFGIVQLEAMSYGVPVLASNIYGVRSIIKNTGGGLLFENKNTNELFKKITNFKKDHFKPEDIKLNLNRFYNRKKFDKKIFDLFKSL